MKIIEPYKPRIIRFVEIYNHNDWQIKVYSISVINKSIYAEILPEIKQYLNDWLAQSKITYLETYQLATLIIHNGKEGVFAIINWWIDENMLQNFVYLKKENETHFELYSDKGIVTCVWEMEIWWHERNAWIKHILMQNENPNIIGYLNDQLNISIENIKLI